MKALQTGNPNKLKLLFKIPFLTECDAATTESYLHKVLSPFSVNGEWFKFEDSVLPEDEKIINGILDLTYDKDFVQISFSDFFNHYFPNFSGKYKVAVDRVCDYVYRNHGIEVRTSCANSEIRVKGKRGFRCRRLSANV
jgi:hypothetical protein